MSSFTDKSYFVCDSDLQFCTNVLQYLIIMYNKLYKINMRIHPSLQFCEDFIPMKKFMMLEEFGNKISLLKSDIIQKGV